LWIVPKKALQYSQITDNTYEAFMMAWGRGPAPASLESISRVAQMFRKVVHPWLKLSAKLILLTPDLQLVRQTH